jgi:hypothetical protein
MRYLPCWVLTLSIAATVASSAALSRRPPKLSPLRAVGNRILNGKGESVWLRGVNTASMEWTSDGEGHILKTVEVAIKDWKVNHIRLPLAQDRWFGKAPEQRDGGKAYRDLVRQIVGLCRDSGVYVILDLHWSDAGVWGQQIGQHVMPDRNSLLFWKDCARTYKNEPAVLFDLYNEPHDVSWDVWLKGGEVTENDRQRRYTNKFEAVGMQTLLDAVRATGAKNLVVAGGLDWAYDLSGFLGGYALKDPKGNGVVYANHNYPHKGDTHERWLEKMRTATARIPVIVSEFGGGATFGRRTASRSDGDPWVRRVLDALQENRWHWTAWDMHPAAGPCLITDWNYTPTPDFGVYVKQALLGTLEKYVPPPSE